MLCSSFAHTNGIPDEQHRLPRDPRCRDLRGRAGQERDEPDPDRVPGGPLLSGGDHLSGVWPWHVCQSFRHAACHVAKTATEVRPTSQQQQQLGTIGLCSGMC